jgi:hypothetical protein
LKAVTNHRSHLLQRKPQENDLGWPDRSGDPGGYHSLLPAASLSFELVEAGLQYHQFLL